MFDNLKKKRRKYSPGKKPPTEIRKIFYSYPVAKTLEDMGCNPFQIMAELAMNSPKERIRLDAATELAKYVSPQLKSVEFKGNKESPVNLILNMTGNADATPLLSGGETYEHGT